MERKETFNYRRGFGHGANVKNVIVYRTSTIDSTNSYTVLVIVTVHLRP
jgi:hypothetical protein